MSVLERPLVPSTYKLGPNLKLTRAVSESDFIRACEAITVECQRQGLWKTDWLLQPEPISEGGMVLQGVPGYKSIRIRHNGFFRWPWINNDVIERWRVSNKIIYPAVVQITNKCGKEEKIKYHTFLKAFRGAPVWTKQELRVINEVFEKEWGARFTSIPSNKSMNELSNVG